MKCIAFCLLLSSAASAADAPDQTPSFPSGVDLVTVDVVITDKKGRPITDLTRSDFTIVEDGQAQNPVSFEKVELPALPNATPAPPQAVSTNAAAEARMGRSFIVVFDDLHMQPIMAKQSKEAIASFLVKGTREGDRVTLVATGGGTWWTARMEGGREQLFNTLKHFEGRDVRQRGLDSMGDYEALRIHAYGDHQVAERVQQRWAELNVPGASGGEMGGVEKYNNDAGPQIDPFVGMRALEIYEESRRRNGIALDVIQRALLSLVGTRGRKSLILVSEGFIYDPNLPHYRRVLEAARRANVAIYFLDTRGLTGLASMFLAEVGRPVATQHVAAAFIEKTQESEGSQDIAEDSGGFVIKNTNDLSAGIEKIASQSRAYYLIGYNPTNVVRDGKWRKIQVKVNRKGTEVHARKGYYAPLPDGEGGESERKKEDRIHDEFRQALDSPRDMEGIPLRLTSYVGGETLLGKATTTVVADIDMSRFAFEENEGRYSDTAEVVLVVTQQETGEFWDRSETIEVGVPIAAKEHLLASPWHSLVRDFDLPPGTFQVKAAVRHPKSGRLGTVTHEFVVPPLTDLRVSSLVLTDTANTPPQADAPPQIKLVARRAFRPGLVFGRFEVFGAAKDTATRAPKVTFAYTLKNKEGATVSNMEARPIAPNATAGIRQLFAFRTGAWAPGHYDLTLTVRDEVAGVSKEIHEPFTIEAGPATQAEEATEVAAPQPTAAPAAEAAPAS